MPLNEKSYLSIYMGGLDGGMIQAAAAVGAGQGLHIIEIMEENTIFTVLTLQSRTTTINALTTNGFAGVAFQPGQFIFAPDGGYISAYTTSKVTRYFTLPSTLRTRSEP